jgi:hypothetical protein
MTLLEYIEDIKDIDIYTPMQIIELISDYLETEKKHTSNKIKNIESSERKFLSKEEVQRNYNYTY